MAKGRENNPANKQSNLFKALTRLFSGPIINYRSQSGRRIRRQHLDKFSSRFKTASGQQFKKSLYNPLDTIATNAIQNQRRSERYIDFDQMEYMPEIASTMDIYSDEMTTYSDLRPTFSIFNIIFLAGRVQCASTAISFCISILMTNMASNQ